MKRELNYAGLQPPTVRPDPISEMDLSLGNKLNEGKYEFRKGVYEGMAIVAKKVEEGEVIREQSAETNRYVVNYLRAAEDGKNVYLLYRPFEESLETFLKNDDAVMKYGHEGSHLCFSEKSRTVVLSVVNTLHFAHANNRVHNKLAGNIFIVRKVIMDGVESKEIYHAVITNNFTQYDTYEARYKKLQDAKNANWREVGKILRYSFPSTVRENLDFEVSELIETLRLAKGGSADFKDRWAVHSPCLWSDPYRLAFDKWALNIAKGTKITLLLNELCSRDDWTEEIPEMIINQKVPGVSGYNGESVIDLIRLVRNMSKHPNGFDYFQPTAPEYPNVFVYLKWKFPKFHVNFVKKCIYENVVEMEKGLKFVVESNSGSSQGGETAKRKNTPMGGTAAKRGTKTKRGKGKR